MTTTPAPLPPDTKDWTWTAIRRCDECGYDPGSVADGAIAGVLRDTVATWQKAVAAAKATERPNETTWSAVEYACHTRDVNDLFADRVARMNAEDNPQFASWDGDQAAIDKSYATQDPASVSAEIAAATERAAAAYDAVANWSRTGMRSDGGTFTISSLGHYHLHDVIHHVHDVTG